jgi:putative FmdB family regulatory protein
MPLYEYECSTCHRRTEKIQKYSDPELTLCPHCGGPLARTITAAAIAFKGSGWYKDLYSSAKPVAAPTADGAPAATPASSSSSDSSAAPAAAPATSSTPAPTAAPATSTTPSPAKSNN